MRRAALFVLLAAGCGASRHEPTVTSAATTPSLFELVDASITFDAESVDAAPSIAVRADAGVESAEIAWLVTHIADNPEPARGGESDAVRRLASMGAPGVHAVAEVFRVGDPRRTPFARRVIERVALSHCHRDRTRAGLTIVHLESGASAAPPPPDAGIIWSSVDDTHWSNASVDRLHRWADEGMTCESPDSGVPSADD